MKETGPVRKSEIRKPKPERRPKAESHAPATPGRTIGKEVAAERRIAMRQIYRLSQNFWQSRPCRWLGAVGFAAAIGVAAGHAMIGSVSGSVSVVSGASMAPTYAAGARVYTAPITAPLERGDIVLIDDGHQEYALKRIVGLPGETVHLWRGRVFVNRKMLSEPYLPKYTYTFPDERSGALTFKLGAVQFFVLGDNRVCSVDSRAYGPVETSRIRSRVPLPNDILRAQMVAYTLPAPGKRTIRPL
jgi:signal peptidase I